MADRVVKVTLRAQIAEFKAGMLDAAQSVRTVGTEAEKLQQTRAAMQQVGTAGIAMGAGLAAGIGVAVMKFADFQQAMSYVAATGDDARGSFGELRDAAIEAGAATVFSATESANAIEEMAKAGVSAKDILAGGLAGALDLAAAGGLGVADAAGIAATALKVFKLEGSDMSHVADLLAAGAGKAMGDVSDLSSALAQGGQVAASTGVSIEETTATLAAFAAQGLLGSDAGTSFKSMLQRLTPQSAEAQRVMDELGISAYDTSGHFIGMAEFAGNLQSAMADLTPEARNSAMAVMFGSDAVRAANVLYTEGEQGLRDWTAAVDDQGYAAETAATRLDNLKGDWEALTGAMDSAFITMGSGADGPLRGLIQGLTGLVDGFNDLPDWMQQLALGAAAAVAGVALLGGAALIAIPKIVEFRLALQTLGMTGGTVRSGLGRFTSFLGGPWGIALLAAAAVFATFTAQIEAGIPRQAELVNGIKTSTAAADAFAAAFERSDLETFFQGDYADALKDLPALLEKAETSTGGLFDAMTFNEQGSLDSIKRYGDALGEIAATDLPQASGAFADLVEQYGLTDAAALELLRQMPGYRDALLGVAGDSGIAADSQEFLALALGKAEKPAQSAAEAYMDAADNASALQDQLRGLIDVVNEANGVGQDAVSKNLDYADALFGVDETIRLAAEGAEGYALSLDTSTEAGRENMGAMVDLAASSQAAADAQFNLDGNTATYKATLEAGRQALIDRAVQFGMNADQAGALADQIYRIPDATAWQAIVETTEAQKAIDAFIYSNDGRTVTIKSSVSGTSMTASVNARGGLYDHSIPAFASGGGFDTGIYSGNGVGIHRFAEKESVWEAFVSGKPDERDRNRGIVREAGRRLGMSPDGATGTQIHNTFHITAAVGTDVEALADRVIEKQNYGKRGAE